MGRVDERRKGGWNDHHTRKGRLMTARKRERELFARWLDVNMSNHHMTGRDIAERIGVHDSAVSRWRSGKGVPTMEALSALAELFGVDPLRLAVLAGLVSVAVAGVEPVDLPEPIAQREEVRKSITSIPGLTQSERQALLERYDELVRGNT